MHELSVADAIVDVVCRHAEGRKVVRVEVRVGHLRQVVPSALEFAFSLVAEGTEAEGAELAMEIVPARVECTRCGGTSNVEGFPLACAHCGQLNVDVVAGEELEIESIEVETEVIGAGRS